MTIHLPKVNQFDGGNGGGGGLPSQEGQAGKFLTTNGSVASWADIPSGDFVATKILNVVEVGNLTRNGAKVSGFSSSDYIKIGSSYENNMVASNFSENIIPLMAVADSWEIMIKFKTSNLNNQIILGQEVNNTTPQIKIYNSKINICLSFDGSTWAHDVGYDTLLANTTYYISLKYTGSSYIVTLYDSSKTQISTNTISDSTKIYNEGIFRFGSDESTNAFEGEIDFSETYIKIDGNFKWKGVIEIYGGTSPKIIEDADNTNLEVEGNTIYKFGTALTSLTISSVETSDYESIIYFTTGAGTITLSVPNTLRWGGGSAPELESNTVYCIAIRNGLAEIDSFGSAS